ncbi:MAG: GNAT family N-acetyltransferase [Treponema sp.]|jgi:GNAT superfamily N-acetyltransferase|nr:GNAT family N-acetyltransferase [Treponema sp.]
MDTLTEKFQIDEHTRLRFAGPGDSGLILDFIRALAEYERLLDSVAATAEGLRQYIFEEKKAEVIIAEYDGEAAGFALYFHTFSTFVGKPGLYLEDLFVKPACRGRGLGKLLLSFLAKLAADRGYGRLEWACLDWNERSIQFYKSQGARPLDEWTTYRVTGEALRELGARFPTPLEPEKRPPTKEPR